MSSIKKRRLKLPLTSHPNLFVGECVPFYFCPRSVMLCMIYRANHTELPYPVGKTLLFIWKRICGAVQRELRSKNSPNGSFFHVVAASSRLG